MKNFKSGNDKRGGFGGGRGGRDDRGGRGDDKPVFYGKSRGGDRSTDREQRMFKAICSDCNKSCDVPFKPSSDKPVFCRDCFSAKRDRETREYKAGLASGEPKKFGQDKPASYALPMHSLSTLPKVDESMKKQVAEMSMRLDKLTALVEKIIEEKKTVSSPSVIVAKAIVSKSVKVASPTKKVASKAVILKKIEVSKVAPKKVILKKSAVKPAIKTIVKKVVAKKTK
jgi:CxxC-x17-CxxC domain-containing protein